MAIVKDNEYEIHKVDIESNNYPLQHAVILSTTSIYDIDLDTREIHGPKFLSMERDHMSEVIYFKVDRFVDNIDLSTKYCFIRYTNAKNEQYIYRVPFYDVLTYIEDNKMVFPWVLTGPATIAAGTVKFAVEFYDVNSNNEYTFRLNTKPATGTVLHGMDLNQKLHDEYLLTADIVTDLYTQIGQLSRDNVVYWDFI